MKIGNVNSVAPAEVAQRAKTPDAQVKNNTQEKSVQQSPVPVDIAQKSGVVDEEVIEKSVEQANKSLRKHDRYIERNVHEVTKAVMYKLKDSETNEVIAEFPPQKVQDMIAKMWELAGLFVDERG